MDDQRLRQELEVAVIDLQERWRAGAPKGDSYKIGFNAGLWNALSLLQGVAEEAGLDPAEIGFDRGWSDVS
jgi:hypothetical protein